MSAIGTTCDMLLFQNKQYIIYRTMFAIMDIAKHLLTLNRYHPNAAHGSQRLSIQQLTCIHMKYQYYYVTAYGALILVNCFVSIPVLFSVLCQNISASSRLLSNKAHTKNSRKGYLQYVFSSSTVGKNDIT